MEAGLQVSTAFDRRRLHALGAKLAAVSRIVDLARQQKDDKRVENRQRLRHVTQKEFAEREGLSPRALRTESGRQKFDRYRNSDDTYDWLKRRKDSRDSAKLVEVRRGSKVAP